ncbi:MAG: addiction module protein [Acidobacteriota bacterium]
MTKTELALQALALPIEEQLDLAQEIWENVSPPPDLRLSDDLRDLLEERRAEALAHPEDAVPWEEVRARLLGHPARKEGHRLIVEPKPRPSLLELLATWEPLDEEFPELDGLNDQN